MPSSQPRSAPHQRPGSPLARRSVLGGAGALSLGALLTACGDEGTATGAAPSSSSPATTSGGFPVTVQHAFGETVVPAKPERVVSAGYTEQDALLALGVVPVAITDWYGDHPYGVWPWAQEALGDAQPTLLSEEDGFQYEAIAGLTPDLVVATNAGLEQDSYDKLSDIAPTVAQAAGAEDWFSPWDEQTRSIGKALGLADEAEAKIAEVKQQFSDALAAHPEFQGKKVVFLQNAVYEGKLIAYQQGLSTDFLTDLGFTVPASLDEFADDGQASIPLERATVLDEADVLLWAIETPEDITALQADPVVSSLRAFREGRNVFTNGELAGAIYFTSLLSLPVVVDQLTPAFADVLAGKGSVTL